MNNHDFLGHHYQDEETVEPVTEYTRAILKPPTVHTSPFVIESKFEQLHEYVCT